MSPDSVTSASRKDARYCGPGGDCDCPAYVGRKLTCERCWHGPRRHLTVRKLGELPGGIAADDASPFAVTLNPLALASLILGLLFVLGVVLFFIPVVGPIALAFLFPILALVFGYRGRKEVSGSRGHQEGRGMATAGIIFGWIGVGLVIVFLILTLWHGHISIYFHFGSH